MFSWDMLLQVIGAVGGLEAVKWIATRKSAGRMARAQAISEESSALSAREKLYEDTILFLQNQLKEKEERFALQTDELRKATASELQLTRRIGSLELRLQSCRCDRFSCRERIPPLWNEESPESDAVD